MYYILKQDTKDWGGLIKQLKKRYMVRCEYSCNQRNAFGIATHFVGTSIREFIFLSEKMCCDDPRMSWVTSRKQCKSGEEFLAKIDEKIDEQIKNQK